MLVITAARVATRVKECSLRTEYQSATTKPRRNLSATYPYRPQVRTTPSDDTPFVVEGSDEFPAGK